MHHQLVAFIAFVGCASSLLAGSRDIETVETAKWPEVWGDLGLRGYIPGDKRLAPNGVPFDPVFSYDVHLNLGLLPQKKLYTFVDLGFWAQRAAPGITNKNFGSYDFSKREFDGDIGLAWNAIDRLELRASVFSLDSLNRGISETLPTRYENGVAVEARYYFGDTNIYDTGRLSYVSLGYYPEENLLTGAGSTFRAGAFLQAHLTYDIPALRSYLFADAKVIAEDAVDPRLIRVNGGLALRPLASLPNLELRVGDEFNADVKDDISRNLVYGEVHGYFGGGTSFARDTSPAVYDVQRSPEVWGEFGIGAYAGGDRVASNGITFTPLFMTDLNLQFGLLPQRKLYAFVDNQFWIQRESANGRSPGHDASNSDINEREWDMDVGLALTLFSRFELRGAVYAQNNLNRAGAFPQRAPDQQGPSGYNDGGHAEIRYYFSSANAYDPSRQNFVEIGYYPSHTLIGGDGTAFHPGAFGRLYLSYDLPRLRSYVFVDGTFIADKEDLRMIIANGGFAVRPILRFENLEFRVGNELTSDVQADTNRDLTYGAIRINFSTR